MRAIAWPRGYQEGGRKVPRMWVACTCARKEAGLREGVAIVAPNPTHIAVLALAGVAVDNGGLLHVRLALHDKRERERGMRRQSSPSEACPVVGMRGVRLVMRDRAKMRFAWSHSSSSHPAAPPPVFPPA